ncbi:MAG: hypothetical protein AAFR55_06375 [Pseudomonadota bacterium]
MICRISARVSASDCGGVRAPVTGLGDARFGVLRRCPLWRPSVFDISAPFLADRRRSVDTRAKLPN